MQFVLVETHAKCAVITWTSYFIKKELTVNSYFRFFDIIKKAPDLSDTLSASVVSAK